MAKTKHLVDVDMQKIHELMEMNKQVLGLQGQQAKHEQAIDNIGKHIKELKANRNKKLQQIVGGNLIIDLDNKEAIKGLQERRAELEKGLKVTNEQLMFRKDNLESAIIRVFRMLEDKLPEDIKDESGN